MPTPPFTYLPLSEPDAFRILHLQPSLDSTAPISCHLEHTTLSKYDFDIIDPYTALSYVWGDVSDPRIIQVDGQPFEVTRNLHDALECLRDEKRILRVWADAVCIDQRNIPERNAQVAQMGRIYSSATHTVIFLDKESRDLELVLREIGPLRAAVQHISAQLRPQQRDFDIETLENVSSAFGKITACPWFRRVWVLQELVLSKDPFVQCGKTRVRWDEFHKFATQLEDFHTQLDNVSPNEGEKNRTRQRKMTAFQYSNAFTLLHTMSNTRIGYHWDTLGPEKYGDTHLSDLVLKRRAHGASDPRDIVYAQIGMVPIPSETSWMLPTIDYSKPTSRVYAEMTHLMLMEGMDIFSHLDRRNTAQHPLGLATWVPDWSSPWEPLRRTLSRSDHVQQQQATDRSLWNRYPTSSVEYLEEKKQALILEAVVTAEIVQLGRAVGQSAHILEGKSIADYFQPEISPHQFEDLLSAWHLGEDDKNAPCLERKFKTILHAWSTALGLPDEELMPDDEVPLIISSFQNAFGRPNQLASDSAMAFMNSCYGGLLQLPLQRPESPDMVIRKSPTNTTNSGLLPTDRVCTVRCTYPPEENKPPHQIIVVPEMSRIGDFIANVDVRDPTNLLVIHRVKLDGQLAGNLPPTYEVVGTCHSNTTIKGSYDFMTLPDRIALV